MTDTSDPVTAFFAGRTRRDASNIKANSTPAMGTFAKIYFSVLLFCGGIIGMSLINSIFVDAMAADNNDDIKQELTDVKQQLEEIKKLIKENK